MIHALRTLVFLLHFLFARYAISQSIPCEAVHEGKFVLEDEVSGVTVITRTGDIQLEENSAYGIVTEDKIEWLSACSFRLIPFRIIKNENQINLDDMQLEIEIIEVRDGSYTQKTKVGATGQVIIYDLKIISPKEREDE